MLVLVVFGDRDRPSRLVLADRGGCPLGVSATLLTLLHPRP